LHHAVCIFRGGHQQQVGGDQDVLLRGAVNSVQKVQLNIKFDGDSHVSPYLKEGFGQCVMRRQLKANDCSYYGIILTEE
jgi:hypothetical protein